MFRHLFLVFSFLGFFEVFPWNTFKKYKYCSNQPIAMVQLCGNSASTQAHHNEVHNYHQETAKNNQIQGCYTTSHRKYHNDGSSTKITIITCSKKEELDENNKVKKSSDVLSPQYQNQLKKFLSH